MGVDALPTFFPLPGNPRRPKELVPVEEEAVCIDPEAGADASLLPRCGRGDRGLWRKNEPRRGTGMEPGTSFGVGVGGSEPRLLREGSLPSEVPAKKKGYKTPPNDAPAFAARDFCGGGVDAAGGVSTSGEAGGGELGDTGRIGSVLGRRLK